MPMAVLSPCWTPAGKSFKPAVLSRCSLVAKWRPMARRHHGEAAVIIRFNVHSVVDGQGQFLLAAEVSIPRLDRDVADYPHCVSSPEYLALRNGSNRRGRDRFQNAPL